MSSRAEQSASTASCPGRPRARTCLPTPPVREAAGDRGGSAVDVFEVRAHGALGQAEAARDLGIGVPVRGQPQQVGLPGVSPGARGPAAFGVQVGLVQVGRSRVSRARSRPEKSGQEKQEKRNRYSRTVRPGPALRSAPVAVLADRALAAHRKTALSAA